MPPASPDTIFPSDLEDIGSVISSLFDSLFDPISPFNKSTSGSDPLPSITSSTSSSTSSPSVSHTSSYEPLWTIPSFPPPKKKHPDPQPMFYPDGGPPSSPSSTSTLPAAQNSTPIEPPSAREVAPEITASETDHGSPSSKTIMCALFIFGVIGIILTVGLCLVRRCVNRRRRRVAREREREEARERVRRAAGPGGEMAERRRGSSGDGDGDDEEAPLPLYSAGMGMREEEGEGRVSRPPSYVETPSSVAVREMFTPTSRPFIIQAPYPPPIPRLSSSNLRDLGGVALTPSVSPPPPGGSEGYCDIVETARKEARRSETEANQNTAGSAGSSVNEEVTLTRRSIGGYPEEGTGRSLIGPAPRVGTYPGRIRRTRAMTMDGNRGGRETRRWMNMRDLEAGELDPPPAYEEAIMRGDM